MITKIYYCLNQKKLKAPNFKEKFRKNLIFYQNLVKKFVHYAEIDIVMILQVLLEIVALWTIMSFSLNI